MPSQLVDDVRRLIRDRQEAGRPVTNLERTFILAALGQRVRAEDVVDELEAAIAAARYTLAESHAEHRPAAIRRLLAAARAALDYDPFVEYDPAAAAPPERARPPRADVDG